jgi:hypothetical protein
MDFYTFSLGLGVSGLGVMALGGFVRHGPAPRAGHGVSHALHGANLGNAHGHASIGQGAHGHALHGQASPGHASHAHGVSAPGHAHGAAWLRAELAWLASPRVWFGVALALGAAGLGLRGWLGGAPLFLVALVLGLLFERYVLTSLWNLTLRFASRPALTLETAVAGDATAVTAFDEDGHGIVQIVLDGQVVQVLGRLTPGSRSLGHRVRAGETLRVEDVDVQRNRCRVSLL